MSAFHLQIGPAQAMWTEEESLQWTMTEALHIGREREALRTETKTLSFNLTALASSYRIEFLLELKQMLMERRHRVILSTIHREFDALHRILAAVQLAVAKVSSERGMPAPVFDCIDQDFLTAVWGISKQLPSVYLKRFKAFFNRERGNPLLFEPGLAEVDCPTANASDSYTGMIGGLRQRVLASALTRSMMVQLLSITEEAYETGGLPLDIYAYSRLLMSKMLRPESVRLLRCKDLIIDTQDEKRVYYLRVGLPKAGTAVRPEANLHLHDEVGHVLEQQRKAVSQRLAYLVDERNARLDSEVQPYTIGDLPLFPSSPKRRMSHQGEERMGFIPDNRGIYQCYITPLKKLTELKLNNNVMRHTMGTQLAVSGCSASTIAAVLLHATEGTARIYVDLLYEGAIDELSDSMQPAFEEHFPVFKSFMSVKDAISPERRIESDITDDGIEMTGGCGRELACSYAPIVCYECPRFIPCYDANHSSNLRLVEEEIRWAENGGLARQTEVLKYKHIANRIRVVMAACDIKRRAVEAEREEAGGAV